MQGSHFLCAAEVVSLQMLSACTHTCCISMVVHLSRPPTPCRFAPISHALNEAYSVLHCILNWSLLTLFNHDFPADIRRVFDLLCCLISTEGGVPVCLSSCLHDYICLCCFSWTCVFPGIIIIIIIRTKIINIYIFKMTHII